MSEAADTASADTESVGPAVDLRDVQREFDGGVVHALNGVTLQIATGEWVALTGPSGCGKTTLLHLMAVLDQPTSGTVRIFGQDTRTLKHPAEFRGNRIGLVFQMHNLLPQLSAQRNVEMAMLPTVKDGRQRAQRARQLLDDVDMLRHARRSPTKLSGGERQRIAIARALANNPPLLLADEPTGSLDTAAARRVVELVQRLRQERSDLTVVMVTHDARVAEAADRIVLMRDGRIEAGDGSAAGEVDPGVRFFRG